MSTRPQQIVVRARPTHYGLWSRPKSGGQQLILHFLALLHLNAIIAIGLGNLDELDADTVIPVTAYEVPEPT